MMWTPDSPESAPLREAQPVDPAVRDHPLELRYAARMRKVYPWRRSLALILANASVMYFVMWILMPRTGPRELPRRGVCAANLRGIGQSAHIYAQDNPGYFPPNLQVLIDEGMLTEMQCYCPKSGNDEPDPFNYYFVAGLNSGDPPTWILAFEDPENHGDGVNILFVDSHVEFFRTDGFKKALARFRKEFEASRGEPAVIVSPQQP